MLDDFQRIARSGADLQREAALLADDAVLHRHIDDTLRRCLPAPIVTADMVNSCFHAVCELPLADDPLHTGAIHAFAGRYLLNAANASNTLLTRLHQAAKRLLPVNRAASRDDLRLVTLDALYTPGSMPPGPHSAYLRHRLGLGCIRLSNEEIALRMHKPLVYIHELEAALLTTLSTRYSGGRHA